MQSTSKAFISMIFFIVCGLIIDCIWDMVEIFKNYLMQCPFFLEGVSCIIVVVFVAFILFLIKIKLNI